MEEQTKLLKQQLEKIISQADLPTKKQEVVELERQTYEAVFWQDAKKAVLVMKKINSLKEEIEEIELIPLLLAEGDLKEVKKLIKKYEIILFLSGHYDQGGAIFSIHAGQGG